MNGHPLGQRLVLACVQVPRRVLIAGVKAYRLLLKPSLGNACRFEPTCSQYALTALERHGAVAGATLATWRILRCHPWCDGGCDEVPERLPGLFGRLGLGASDARGSDIRKGPFDTHGSDTATAPDPRASATTVQEYER